MSYIFYLDKTILPITPSKLDVKVTSQNTTMSLINGENINILKSPGLSEISFDCVIPQTNYPFAVYPSSFLGAKTYLDKFEKLKTQKKPFQFIVSRMSPGGKFLFSTNLTVSLEEYNVNEDASQGLDLVVSITLKQYNNYSTKVMKIEKDEAGKEKIVATEKPRQAGKEIPKTYTVKEGDTMFNIVKKIFGSETLYNEILASNNIVNPNLVTVGQVISFEQYKQL